MPAGPRDPEAARAAKTALRDQLLTARGRRPLLEVSQAAQEIAEHLLASPEVTQAASLALYVSVGPEPGTGLLLEELHRRGKRVLLPVVLRGGGGLDLDWAPYAGEESLAAAGYGLLEPTTELLGCEAIATADVVLAPGLAVGPTGARIGRGAGCYDKALSRVPDDTWICALMYQDETGREVPTEPHDRPVSAVVTPAGITRFR